MHFTSFLRQLSIFVLLFVFFSSGHRPQTKEYCISIQRSRPIYTIQNKGKSYITCLVDNQMFTLLPLGGNGFSLKDGEIKNTTVLIEDGSPEHIAHIWSKTSQITEIAPYLRTYLWVTIYIWLPWKIRSNGAGSFFSLDFVKAFDSNKSNSRKLVISKINTLAYG